TTTVVIGENVKITKIELIYPQEGALIEGEHIPCIWVRVHTDEGITGLGETYPLREAEQGVIRGRLASMLIGQNPLEIERLWQEMFHGMRVHGWAGAELRAISAIDIALWDIYGKATGQPIYQLLGGKSREKVRTYNTCYDHRYDFNNVENNEAGKLAKELLDSGIQAMKVWPFDGVGYKNRGQFITNSDIEIGLKPVQQIRDAVGDDIEIAMEFHGSVPVEEGHLTAPESPGLGIDLKPELLNAPGIEIETIGNLLHLKPYVIRYRSAVIASFFFVLTTNVVIVVQPKFLKWVFDDLERAVTPGMIVVQPKFLKWVLGDLESAVTSRKVLFYALLILGAALVGGILRFGQRQVIQSAARKMEYHLRNDFFTHLQKLPASYYQDIRTGDLMARATSDMNAIRMVLSMAVSYTSDALIFFVLALVIMLQIDVQLTLLALLPYPILAILIRELGKRVYKHYERIQEGFATMNTKVQENLSGVRVVKAYTLEASEVEEFEVYNQDFVQRNRNRIRLTTFFFPVFRFLPDSALLRSSGSAVSG
ncbi:Probable multidrug resistance ABC transporter ATP-binding/permease protein YheI, partial [Geodia barretti]